MTKSRAGRKFRKAPEAKITVHSKAYGRHERAARGSRSKAVLNDAMKEHGRRMISSNIPAKLIHDALQPYRTNFKGGLIWQRLVKHFAAQAKANEDYSVLGIDFWDLNKAYPTSRVMSPNIKITVNPRESDMNIHLNYAFSDRFLTRNKGIQGFQVTIILLFPDFVHNEIIAVPTVLPEKKLEDQAPYAFIVDIPEGADSYITCFKAEACLNGKPIVTSGNVNKVMCFLESGIM